MERLSVVEADLDDARHGEAIVALVGSYARDEDGNPVALPREVQETLVPALREHPTSLVLLALDGDRPVGVAVCFFGFSTFAAKPVLNLHDLVVSEELRGRGVGRRLLDEVEARARAQGCSKVTLEVHETNASARALYRKTGFRNGETAGERVFFLERFL